MASGTVLPWHTKGAHCTFQRAHTALCHPTGLGHSQSNAQQGCHGPQQAAASLCCGPKPPAGRGAAGARGLAGLWGSQPGPAVPGPSQAGQGAQELCPLCHAQDIWLCFAAPVHGCRAHREGWGHEGTQDMRAGDMWAHTEGWGHVGTWDMRAGDMRAHRTGGLAITGDTLQTQRHPGSRAEQPHVFL